MSAEASAEAETGTPLGVDLSSARTDGDEEPKNTFLPLTTGVEPTVAVQENHDAKKPIDETHDADAVKDATWVQAMTDTLAEQSVAGTKPIAERPSSRQAVNGGRDSPNTLSSIWSTAAATLKNLVVGKPQPQPPEIVTVVPAPGSHSSGSTSVMLKIDKGKTKAIPDEAILPVNNTSISSSSPSHSSKAETRPKAQQRPSVPPPRLSSIAHSLPTSHATVPSPEPPAASSTSTRSPSLQSPQSATSNATETSATTATDEENQAAALAALNAVIHSVGTGYTQPLTSRAAQLHSNDLMLAQQREKLMHTTNLLAKDTATLQKLAIESNNKLKSFGDLNNWTTTMDNDLLALEETLRIVDRGSLELCAKCEEGISEEEPQRWCGICGKGFHEACAPPDPEQSSHDVRMPGLGDDYEEPEDYNDLALYGRHIPQPHEVALPDSLPSTVQGIGEMVGPSAAKEFGATPPTIPFSQPSVPKPSSMFEWGGIPDAIRDIAALRERGGSDSGNGSGSESGTSEWSGEDWRCQECRLKADLDGIVEGL